MLLVTLVVRGQGNFVPTYDANDSPKPACDLVNWRAAVSRRADKTLLDTSQIGVSHFRIWIWGRSVWPFGLFFGYC